MINLKLVKSTQIEPYLHKIIIITLKSRLKLNIFKLENTINLSCTTFSKDFSFSYLDPVSETNGTEHRPRGLIGSGN